MVVTAKKEKEKESVEQGSAPVQVHVATANAQLTTYPEDFKKYIEKTVKQVTPLLEELFGMKIPKLKVVYSPYPAGYAAAVYVPSENTMIITPHMLNYFNEGADGKRSLDHTIAHEMGHAYITYLLGINDDGYGVKDTIAMLAKSDGGTQDIVDSYKRAPLWEKTLSATHEGVADLAGSYATVKMKNKNATNEEVFLDMIDDAKGSAMMVKIALRPQDFTVQRVTVPGFKEAMEQIEKIMGGPNRIGASMLSGNNYIRPQILLAEEFSKDTKMDISEFVRDKVRSALDSQTLAQFDNGSIKPRTDPAEEAKRNASHKAWEDKLTKVEFTDDENRIIATLNQLLARAQGAAVALEDSRENAATEERAKKSRSRAGGKRPEVAVEELLRVASILREEEQHDRHVARLSLTHTLFLV